ncbi:protein kinase domain-containing protein [Coleofasciculus sp. G2-EDA-02]|uniref:protein kinase domain-containing protein n=1 Tax=Coleofasciculus sp. G2-EDA-02 TaxID=3069529 RepID=UPI003304F503
MSYCINPNCPKPENKTEQNFCQTCGTKLIVAERYRPLRLLGVGGLGRTLLAEDESQPSKPYCAIKQFYPQGQNNSPKAAQLFHQEAERLKELGNHPQIPEFLAYFEQNNYQYIVQEFIDGQNLNQELSEIGAFSEGHIRSLLSDLLPVLQFIHQGNVIHRDIKPENIIRRRRDRKLVLVDFGAAKYATWTILAKTGTTIGSAGYAAPEQTFGKAVFASDIYSLGVTCIHLLTQMQPFDLYEPLENGFVWRQYLVNNPVSQQLADIMDKMIHPLLKQRYHSVEEVRQDFCQLGIIQAIIQHQTNSPKPEINASFVHTLPGHSGGVDTVAFSPDKKSLASGSVDKTIKLWQVSMAWEIRTLGGWFSGQHTQDVSCLAFSPNGKYLVSGSRDTTLKLWKVRTGKKLVSAKSHNGGVYSVAFSPNKPLLASCGRDSTIRIWQSRRLTTLQVLSSHSRGLNCVAFSPDGQILASGSLDGTIELWHVPHWQKLETLAGHLNSVDAIAFSPDSITLASGSSDGMIRLWDIRTLTQTSIIKGNLLQVRSLAFSPDGRLLASCGGDNRIRIWHVATGQDCCILEGHTDTVQVVAFSPDGQTLASGSCDRTIKIWRVWLL